eukprot:5020675-Pyramimonas_sp.AAC.1
MTVEMRTGAPTRASSRTRWIHLAPGFCRRMSGVAPGPRVTPRYSAKGAMSMVRQEGRASASQRQVASAKSGK